MFIDAQQKSLLEEKVSRLEEDIANLKAAILSQQKTIAEMDAKDSVQTRIAATYEAELQQRLQQLTAAQAELQRVQKALRSQRRKTKLVAFGGLALATGAGWLFSR